MKKNLDAADFISMAQHHPDEINNKVLFSLGEMAKNGGGKEILELVEAAKAGKRLDIRQQ